MRRVDRGPWPQEDGHRKVFRPYRKAKSDLLKRLGRYCSYCERRGDLHVEHVVPKVHRSDLAEEWTNFLLGCVNCNSIKGSRNRSRDGYTWPDEDVPWSAFDYLPGGRVEVAANLPDSDRIKAERLFDLVGLGRRPAADPEAKDMRYLYRLEAWDTAQMARNKLDKKHTDTESVVELAKATGFWSVWMKVFEGNADVRGHLRDAFPGSR